jgi:hypothetical protein
MSEDKEETALHLKRQLQGATAEERTTLLAKQPYEVGYAKPPKSSRFQPGQSGNRKGRPRGTLNISTIIDVESTQKVTINEGGRRRTLSKAQVGIRQLFNKAASGDAKAIAAVIDLLRKAGKINDAPAPPPSMVDARDLETAEKLLAFFQSSRENPERDR